MKKVVNVEPSDVFTLLAAEKEVYAIDTSSDAVTNLYYHQVCNIVDMIKAGERAFFIVEEEAET